MVLLRAPVAHGTIVGLDVGPARAMPGVRLVLTAADLERLGVGPMSVRSRMANGDGTAMVEPERPVLARDAVKRSEEHTSELQSLMRISYAVFCLKKKKKNTI